MITIRAERDKCTCFHAGGIMSLIWAGMLKDLADDTRLHCEHGSRCRILFVNYPISDFKLFLTVM